MAGSVKPVVADFICEEQQSPNPPLVSQLEDPPTVDQSEDPELHGLGNQVDGDVAQPHGDAGGGVLTWYRSRRSNASATASTTSNKMKAGMAR